MINQKPKTNSQENWDHDTLTWEDSFAIARNLRASYPNQNLDELSLGTIYRWTIALPGFDDDHALANDGILMAIYQEWLEEELAV
jgi:FeS assembly protein IscX